jgi:membrane-associated phospholipid phosphatase
LVYDVALIGAHSEHLYDRSNNYQNRCRYCYSLWVANRSTRKGTLTAGAAFVAFSGAVALGWLYKVDSWVLWTTHDYPSDFLDAALSMFSLPGSVEVAGTTLLALLAVLFLRGRQMLAGRLLTIFVVTEILEFAMKLYLPQVPLPAGSARAEDFALLVSATPTYPYPSGHMLRGTILLGAFYFLSGNWFLRVVFLVVFVGIAASRVYFGQHWASDVVGGALLGTVALLWAFGGKTDLKLSKDPPATTTRLYR